MSHDLTDPAITPVNDISGPDLLYIVVMNPVPLSHSIEYQDLLTALQSDLVIPVDHGALTGLLDDDHLQYSRADGTRAFTAVVVGVTPVNANHLSTKGYIDGKTWDHGASLTGLGDDDHTQYALTAGRAAGQTLVLTVNDAATNTIIVGETIQHNSSGTPAAGFGVSQIWQLESTTTENRDVASLAAYWGVATDASRKGTFEIRVMGTPAGSESTVRAIRVSAGGTNVLGLGPRASVTILGQIPETYLLAPQDNVALSIFQYNADISNPQITLRNIGGNIIVPIWTNSSSYVEVGGSGIIAQSIHTPALGYGIRGNISSVMTALDAGSTCSFATYSVGTPGGVRIGASADSGTAPHFDNTTCMILCLAAAKAGLTVKGQASQTANLCEWLKSDATVYGSISENGYWTTRKNAAPADGELVAGELALWFDSTNGASKLMIKAKQADGTVKTANVPLA